VKPIRRIALALCVCTAAAFAADFAALKPEGYVSDFARVIDPASRAQLERYCANLERSTGAQLALVTLPSLEGEPVEDVANALFRAWGIGRKGENNGALLLLSIGDRRSRLEVGYGLEPIITDGEAGSLLRAMAPELRAGQYGAALLTASTEIGTRIAQAKNVAIETPAPARPRSRREDAPVLPLFAFAAIMFALLSLSARGRSRRRGYRSGGMDGLLPGLIIGALMNRPGGFHRGGGGGFGGYDSGGGFGGFGGGDSGGGGASSSW
jgi:uncharacterized protein